MIDKIRWFPIVDATGYPQKTDGTQRRIEKHQEEHRAIVASAKAQDKLDDLLFELYCKKAEHKKFWQKEKGKVYIGDNNVITGLVTIDAGTEIDTFIGNS